MLLNVFRVATRDEELSKAVRSALLDALFASKASLVIGLFIGGSMAGIIVWSAPNPWLIGCATLLLLSGLSRVITFGMFRPGSGVNNKWEILYHAGAWSYAALMGQMSFLTALLSDNISHHLLAATMSTT